MKSDKTKKEIIKIINNFCHNTVIVVGDLILDEFVWGEVGRISPEAPVPVLEVKHESFMPGGAANVATNIAALGGRVNLIGLVGDDHRAGVLNELLKNSGVDVSGVMVDYLRPTTLKTRIIARQQQIVRVDREKLSEINKKQVERILSYIEKNIDSSRAVLLEDYGKGMIIPDLIRGVVKFAKKNNLIVTVDPKEENIKYYRGVTCLTPNTNEAGQAANIIIKDKTTLAAAGKKLLRNLNTAGVLITLGEDGMCLFEKSNKITSIPTRAQEVFDVSGAGDTVIAAFTLALASGATMQEAAHISNYAAGIVVGKLGVATCSQEELIARISNSR
ncbi:MAG: D-glycero-beta-D-manno-heptose-7-phosphate kinase [Candidatus Omnitrophota bacterium]